MIATTSLALLYALWGVDMALLGRLLAGAHLWVLGPFIGLLTGFYLCTGLRWNVLLRPLGRFTLAQSGPVMMIGFAGNNIFPAHLGELARAFVFSRRYGLPVSSIFASLVAERILDVFSILFFYFMAVLLLDPFPEAIRLGAETAAVLTAAGCAVIVLFLFFPGAVIGVYRRLVSWLPAGIGERGAAMLGHAALGLSGLKTQGLLLELLVFSLLKWMCGGGMVWFALTGFDTPISFSVSMIVIAVNAVAVTVPSAPGYFGAMQAAFVFALVPFGIPKEVALASSVFYLISQWLPVTLFGAASFVALGLRWRELRDVPQQAP